MVCIILQYVFCVNCTGHGKGHFLFEEDIAAIALWPSSLYMYYLSMSAAFDSKCFYFYLYRKQSSTCVHKALSDIDPFL